jgi:thioesterase domain-containing protein
LGCQDPHLASGQTEDLSASVHDLCTTWARAILATTADIVSAATMGGGRIDLIGLSMGGVCVSIVASRIGVLGGTVSRMVMIDPVPPAPWSSMSGKFIDQMTSLGPAFAAYYLRIRGDPEWAGVLKKLPQMLEVGASQAREWAYAVGATLSLQQAGICNFTVAALVQTEREMRVMCNGYRILSKYASPLESPADYFDGPSLLVLATERVPFFQEVYGNTAEEASASACRQLGNVVKEIVVEGDHIEVCAKCMLLQDVDELCRELPAFLSPDAYPSSASAAAQS